MARLDARDLLAMRPLSVLQALNLTVSHHTSRDPYWRQSETCVPVTALCLINIFSSSSLPWNTTVSDICRVAEIVGKADLSGGRACDKKSWTNASGLQRIHGARLLAFPRTVHPFPESGLLGPAWLSLSDLELMCDQERVASRRYLLLRSFFIYREQRFGMRQCIDGQDCSQYNSVNIHRAWHATIPHRTGFDLFVRVCGRGCWVFAASVHPP